MSGKKGRSGRRPNPRPAPAPPAVYDAKMRRLLLEGPWAVGLTLATMPPHDELAALWAAHVVGREREGAWFVGRLAFVEWARGAPPPRTGSRAQRVVRVMNQLTHTGDYAEQPFTLRAWQRQMMLALFKTGRDRRRLVRTALLMLPRKNGKTELAAAIAIFCLLFDGASGGEIYLAAADRDQAGKVYQAIVAMVRADPELEARVLIVESQKRIQHPASGSLLKAISAEAYSKHGFNASVVIYDELHAAQTRDLWDVLATSQGARLEPLLIAISTAGYDRNSILYELYTHAKRVQENPALDPTFLPIIFEAPKEADWRDERVWKKANPALGDFRSLEDMRIMATRAAEIPAQENVFRRLYLNQWTEQATRWMALEMWDKCQADRVPRAGRVWYVGMDLSMTTDLTAIVGVSPDPDGVTFAVRAMAFLPQARIRERVTRDRAPYDEWGRRGQLTITPGNVVDYERVRAELQQWDADSAGIREIAYDPYNATDLVQRLKDADGFTCIPIRQGTAMSAPTKALEQAVLSQTLRHDGDPVLRWCLGNTSVESDTNGNIKPSKRVSTERIDSVVALVMAIDRLQRNAVPPPKPTYNLYVFGGHP
jgi:phage terminase large subunit-like protein